jgi:hypothetical protein
MPRPSEVQLSIGLDAQTKIPAWLRSCSPPSLTEH